MPTIVYLVREPSYTETTILGVFLTLEDAQACRGRRMGASNASPDSYTGPEIAAYAVGQDYDDRTEPDAIILS